jgi:hypothetical protein
MATAPARERAVPELLFPLGMCNAAKAYASSASIDVAARGGRPGRHVPGDRNPTTTTKDESYHGSASELPPITSHGYTEWDFSGIPDPVMFQWFLDVADYWFGYFDNSSARCYDPARECFVVVASDQANAMNTAGAGDEEAPQNPGAGLFRGAGPSAPRRRRRGVLTFAQLAQARELEVKLTKEYHMVRLLRASIAGEASAHSERARELGKQARERINNDFDVDNPNTPPRASQKLIAATALLRDTPTPSTPETRNLHREAQALIEQAVVQQAESSASRIRQQGSARDDGDTQGPEASVHAGGTTGQPANQGRTPVREWILDT